MRVRLDIGYEGTAFHGWARQDDVRTVQGELERGLELILGSKHRITVAGRTDAGVHARGQVAHIDVPDDTDLGLMKFRLNRLLDDDLRVHQVTATRSDFDARFSALERHYTYRIADDTFDPLYRNHIVDWPRTLDVEAMNRAATLVLGEHDFASFCKPREGATTIRELKELNSTRDGAVISTQVRADAFCHSMVRALMGALVAIGEGKHDPSWMRDILDAKQRSPLVKVMPAHGLVLERVTYPEESEFASRAAESRNIRTVGD